MKGRKGDFIEQRREAFSMSYDLHIVRSQVWPDAEKNPILKSDVDALVKADRELSWSTTDYIQMKDKRTGDVVRYFGVIWKGQPSFWWFKSEVISSSPTDPQIAKMVTMAQSLARARCRR